MKPQNEIGRIASRRLSEGEARGVDKKFEETMGRAMRYKPVFNLDC